MRVIISFITYNCLKYTKLCLKSIKCSFPHEILVIDNGSTDGTVEWLKTQQVTLIENGQNLGVPYASNTIYDYAWKDDPDNLLIVVSNDNVLLPNAIDNLVKASQISRASVVSGDTISSPIYLARYPEDRKFFIGGDRISLLSAKWSPGKYYNLIEKTADDFISAMYSRLLPLLEPFPTLAEKWGFFIPGHRLYKKSFFDVVGYWDANFYPIYSTDFDVTMRAKLLNQPCDVAFSSLAFEFWSRVIYEGLVPVVDVRRDDYYRDKWGEHATDVKGWDVPFNGKFPDKYKGYDTSKVKIDSRNGELERVKQLMGSNFRGSCDPSIGSIIVKSELKEFDKGGALLGNKLREDEEWKK